MSAFHSIPQLTIKFFNIAWNFKFKRHQRAITSSCVHISLAHSKLLGLKMIGFLRVRERDRKKKDNFINATRKMLENFSTSSLFFIFLVLRSISSTTTTFDDVKQMIFVLLYYSHFHLFLFFVNESAKSCGVTWKISKVKVDALKKSFSFFLYATISLFFNHRKSA